MELFRRRDTDETILRKSESAEGTGHFPGPWRRGGLPGGFSSLKSYDVNFFNTSSRWREIEGNRRTGAFCFIGFRGGILYGIFMMVFVSESGISRLHRLFFIHGKFVIFIEIVKNEIFIDH